MTEEHNRHNDLLILDELSSIRIEQARQAARQNIIYDLLIGKDGKTEAGEPTLAMKINQMYPVLVGVRGAKYTVITAATVGAAYLWLKGHWPF